MKTHQSHKCSLDYVCSPGSYDFWKNPFGLARETAVTAEKSNMELSGQKRFSLRGQLKTVEREKLQADE
jgi:hypothetical protein